MRVRKNEDFAHAQKRTLYYRPFKILENYE
nr:MAG TPA: hypothetical protein [Caudoviricetes sp.]